MKNFLLAALAALTLTPKALAQHDTEETRRLIEGSILLQKAHQALMTDDAQAELLFGRALAGQLGQATLVAGHAWNGLAEIHFLNGRRADARRAWTQAAQVFENHPEAPFLLATSGPRRGLARLALESGDFRDALAELARAEAHDRRVMSRRSGPSVELGFFLSQRQSDSLLKARALAGLGRPQDALDALDRHAAEAAALDPVHGAGNLGSDIFDARAGLLAGLGRAQEAREETARAKARRRRAAEESLAFAERIRDSDPRTAELIERNARRELKELGD